MLLLPRPASRMLRDEDRGDGGDHSASTSGYGHAACDDAGSADADAACGDAGSAGGGAVRLSYASPGARCSSTKEGTCASCHACSAELNGWIRTASLYMFRFRRAQRPPSSYAVVNSLLDIRALLQWIHTASPSAGADRPCGTAHSSHPACTAPPPAHPCSLSSRTAPQLLQAATCTTRAAHDGAGAGGTWCAREVRGAG